MKIFKNITLKSSIKFTKICVIICTVCFLLTFHLKAIAENQKRFIKEFQKVAKYYGLSPLFPIIEDVYVGDVFIVSPVITKDNRYILIYINSILDRTNPYTCYESYAFLDAFKNYQLERPIVRRNKDEELEDISAFKKGVFEGSNSIYKQGDYSKILADNNLLKPSISSSNETTDNKGNSNTNTYNPKLEVEFQFPEAKQNLATEQEQLCANSKITTKITNKTTTKINNKTECKKEIIQEITKEKKSDNANKQCDWKNPCPYTFEAKNAAFPSIEIGKSWVDYTTSFIPIKLILFLFTFEWRKSHYQLYHFPEVELVSFPFNKFKCLMPQYINNNNFLAITGGLSPTDIVNLSCDLSYYHKKTACKAISSRRKDSEIKPYETLAVEFRIPFIIYYTKSVVIEDTKRKSMGFKGTIEAKDTGNNYLDTVNVYQSKEGVSLIRNFNTPVAIACKALKYTFLFKNVYANRFDTWCFAGQSNSVYREKQVW
jgi:hypothetical protein